MTRTPALLTALLLAGACGGSGGASDDAGADACAIGMVGCACDEANDCGRGQCVEGVCRLCTRGDEGCLCLRDGSCGTDLLCRGGVCASCPTASGGCPCAEGDVCDEGQVCGEGVCGAADCPPGEAGCACRRRSTPICDEELSCLGDGACHRCEADRAGCPCDADGACAPGLGCDLGVCLTPPSCEDLVASGFCAPNQVCGPGTDGVAACPEPTCVAGFVWESGRCLEGVLNCRAGEPGSLVMACAAQSRACVEEVGGVRCGDCVGETTEIAGECVGPVPCGDARCASFEYCDRSGESAFCADLPCPAGEAIGTDGACRACDFTCGGEGLSGRVFPFRTLTDACVCETLPGFYMPPGGRTTPEPCDADGDGWVRGEVVAPQILTDGALRQNARCNLVEVDGVLLTDEQGISLEVTSCVEGLLIDPDPVACSARLPMPLVETQRNDTPGPLPELPSYGAGGRRLEGAEVNDLTKFCVSDSADFNDDEVDDLLEVQADPRDVRDEDGRTRLRSFSYFGELQRAYVRPAGAGERRPKLVIEERFRCDARDFPLRYDASVDPSVPTDRYSASDPAVFWRSCQRGADPGFAPDEENPPPGNDFAQWTCPDASCAGVLPGPPDDVRDLVVAPLPFGEPLAEGATLCELGARRPADGRFRGLHHHSQFKCVQVGGSSAGGRDIASFTTGDLVLNRCQAARCDAGDASCAASRPVSPTGTAIEPVLACAAAPAADVTSGEVGFAAVRYRPYGAIIGEDRPYRGGCVNEDEEFSAHLCPPPIFGTTRTASELAAGFGRETCFVAECPLGFASCDGNPFNGCEFEAKSLEACSGCNTVCALAHAMEECDTGLCRIEQCEPGWGDCDTDPGNGCENDLNNAEHCGACGEPCTDLVVGGVVTPRVCDSGSCNITACPADPAFGSPTGDCDGDGANGCELLLTDDLNCGECEQACEFNNAMGTCDDLGRCVFSGCLGGFADCDGDEGNGCEIDLRTNEEHCGACSVGCDFTNATGTCADGLCVLGDCHPGFDSCDFNPLNGCEASLRSLEFCGGCLSGGCDIMNATEQCNELEECTLVSCDSGLSDCNHDLRDGCEVDHTGASGECSRTGARMVGLGGFPGDSRCGAPSCSDNSGWDEIDVIRGRGSMWLQGAVTENSSCGRGTGQVEHRLRLKSPPGFTYRLSEQRACETGAASRSRTAGPGTTATLVVGVADVTGDQDFEYFIRVEYVGGDNGQNQSVPTDPDGPRCGEWELVVEGHDC